MTVILQFIGFGISHIDVSNWTPFIPKNTGHWGHYGWSGILTGAGVIISAGVILLCLFGGNRCICHC